jgi:ubiquinone/menaquinone biosynthesis C-methylase UbiE
MLTATSRAYATFCERLYGKNLCQAGFSDMGQIEKLVEVIQPCQDSWVLDVGCGTGMLAEYIAGRTGARVWGVDYSPEAIRQALDRTRSKRDRLNFLVANMDTLDFPDESFDTVISIDTLYMPANLGATLRKLMAMLRPGGQLAAFYSHAVWDSKGDRAALLPANTPLGESLRNLGLTFRTWDFTEQTYRLMQRKRQIGEELRQAFKAESCQALYDFIIAESESSSAPFDPQTCTQSRFLYYVRKRSE